MSFQEPPQTLILRHTGSSPLLSVIEGFEIRPIDPKKEYLNYCHFYRLPSGYHLSKDVCKASGYRHITEGLDGQILHDVRAGKCLLVIDNSPEGHINPQKDFFVSAINDIIADVKPSQPLLFVDQNRALAKPGECSESFNGLRDKSLFLNYDFYIKKLALNIVDNRPLLPFLPREAFINSTKATFLCLFGTPRPVKLALYKRLLSLGLMGKACFSYQGFKGKKAKDDKRCVIDKISSSYLKSAFQPLSTKREIERCVDKLPLSRLDISGNVNMNDIATQMPYRLFSKGHCSLVVETEFSFASMQRITEKTVKALASGHPSIVFGNPFSIRLVRDLGFDTFDDIIDHEYDSIEDPSLRFEVVLLELMRLVSRIEANPVLYSSEVYERALQNYNHAHSGRFLSTYKALVEDSLAAKIRHFLGGQCLTK